VEKVYLKYAKFLLVNNGFYQSNLFGWVKVVSSINFIKNACPASVTIIERDFKYPVITCPLDLFEGQVSLFLEKFLYT